MHTAHRNNRKSKSDSSIVSIEGASQSDWDILLQKTVGKPKAGGLITPEIRKFITYARAKRYTFGQIAKAVNAMFGVRITPEHARATLCKAEFTAGDDK